MKLPIPQELLDQLTLTADLMQRIVDSLGAIEGKLDRLIELDKARE